MPRSRRYWFPGWVPSLARPSYARQDCLSSQEGLACDQASGSCSYRGFPYSGRGPGRRIARLPGQHVWGQPGKDLVPALDMVAIKQFYEGGADKSNAS